MVNEIKSEILFNRAILWLVMMHLTDSKLVAALFAIGAICNVFKSLYEGWEL